MTQLPEFLGSTASRILPRILTQVCRDPSAPFYGSCDRNWWHYKIRDFPSIILQQAGYSLATAAELPANSESRDKLLEIAKASALFWNERAIRHGAFEEYYPFEQGYPPAAFSTLAVAKLCHQGVVALSEIRKGLKIAVGQLTTRFEAQAANQQIAGTAALSVIRSLDRTLISENLFNEILSKTLALQHPEGWFPEYDGPDLGYLAVSIDCLWDIFDHTNDDRVRPAIHSAADYIAWFILSPIGKAGMHNSRNTDYLVPYGLVRLALEDPACSASAVVTRFFSREPKEPTFHCFDAVDDRYWCHYTGHSVFRALALLKKKTFQRPQHELETARPTNKPGSGHSLLSSVGGATALVSARKGAITTARWPKGAVANDFGWLVDTGRQLYVTHWWSNDWKVEGDVGNTSCEGYLVSHKEHTSTPLKHLILRCGSFILGRWLIKVLKRLVIFKKPENKLHFSRTVGWDKEILVINDTLQGLSPAVTITRAPRTSKRHVASADSYHPEDLQMLVGTTRTENITLSGGTFTCETRYLKAVGS